MQLLPYDRGWQGSGRAQGNLCPEYLAKGWLTRLIGRLLKEASPINWLAKELPAKIPSKRRFVVPELPMALTPTAAAASLASNFVSQLT